MLVKKDIVGEFKHHKCDNVNEEQFWILENIWITDSLGFE